MCWPFHCPDHRWVRWCGAARASTSAATPIWCRAHAGSSWWAAATSPLRRPAVDARLVIPWVDQTGQPYPIEDGSELWLEFRDNGSLDVHLTRLHGTESTWTIDGVAGFRGMPLLVGTNDGGAMISLQDSFDMQSESRIVVMHPDGTMEEHSIAPYFPRC